MNAVSPTSSAELKINESRAELERLLIDDDEKNASAGGFPRSQTLRLLTSNGGILLLTVAAGGLMVLRPALLKRALSFVPMSAMLRMLTNRFLRN